MAVRNRTDVDVDSRELNRILRELPGRRRDNVRAVAFIAEGRMKQGSPFDTGANRSSVYTETGSVGAYQQAAGAARSRRPDVRTARLPIPENDGVVHVGPTTDYAAALEFGTSKQPARPYVVPAVRGLEKKLRAAARDMATGGRNR